MIASLVNRLIAAGVDPAEAAEVIALAAVEGARLSAPEKSKAAIRTERWRHKTSQNVTSDDNPETSQNVTERHAVTVGDAPSRVRDITSTSVDTGKKKDKNLVLDLDFEAVWRAYPHRKGRSSKPKSEASWKALSKEHRSGMLAAVKRYADEGHEPKADCGAKAMELWLRDHRFLDWMPQSQAPPLLTAAERVIDDAKWAAYIDRQAAKQEIANA